MRFPNGYGTVYKLNGNRKRPYIARITIGWNGDGKPMYQTLGYYEDRKDGLSALSTYWGYGIIPRQDVTLDNIYDEWSESHYQNITHSTKMQYVAAWKKLTALHKVKFVDLRTSHFQTIINNCSKTNKKGTLEKLKLLVTTLYNYAIQNDIVNKNYGSYIILPKEDKIEKQIFNDFDIKKLWDNLDKPYVNMILILIYTGLRVGELLKLTKFDIDLKSRTITGGLKTDAGKNRTIPISNHIYCFIETLYNKANIRLIDMTYGQFKQVFDKTLADLDINGKTPHCTRHTFATLMAKSGADTVALQKIIGHANYSTTADIYTHLDTDTLKKAIDKI